MRTITATEFKNKAAEILKEVSTSGKPVMVTKRGKPMVRVESAKPEPNLSRLGAMVGTARIVGDIMSPVFDEWETLDPNEDTRRGNRRK